MGFDDPFSGYSLALRTILFVALPVFAVWQTVRLRRALHVFQLEGYRPARFLAWCRSNRRRALFLERSTAKKPLVMTGRAVRLLTAAAGLSVVIVLAVAAAAHLLGGWPYDIPAWALATVLVFLGAPRVLVTADRLLAPVQEAINRHYVAAARRRLREVSPVVIGVTGSFGKTSTKFAVAGLLGAPGAAALATPGSFNTPLGVCRAINEGLDLGHRYLVVEMGAYGPGEIAELCRLVSPVVGVLTAIGPAHLERFGSLDAIRRTKYELVECLPEGGVAVMNCDDREVRVLADRTAGVSVIRYGLDLDGRPDITSEGIEITPEGTRLTLVDRRDGRRLATSTRLLGAHAIGHVLAGVAVGLHLGRPLEELGVAVSELEPVEHRLQLLRDTGGVTVIDDAYNSNPQGAEVALEVLGKMPARRRVVVTPGIVELGPLQFEANRRLGEQAAAVADWVIVVAPLNRSAIVAGAEADGGTEVVSVDSLAQARERLGTLIRDGDAVLFENDLPDHYES